MTFKILSDKEHILTRPNMYIGAIDAEAKDCFISGVYDSVKYVPGLLKIINEIIDNTIDEAIRTGFEYANQVSVVIDENQITVADNGRGIPQDFITDTTGKQILRPEAAWTRTKAGSNFDDERVGIGANGVGSALTNFFSYSFTGVTCDGTNTVTVRCSNNADKIFVKQKAGGVQGTSVTFIPDFTRFGVYGLTKDDSRIVVDRLETLAVCFPEITFKFNGKKVHHSLKKYAKLYQADIVQEVKDVTLFIGPAEEQRHNSFVNGVGTVNGGIHVEYVTNRLCDEIIPIVKRKHKIDVTRNNLRNGMMIGLFMRNVVNPKFDSQTKERLTNSQAEISPYLKGLPFDKLAKKVVDDEAIIGPVIDALVAKQLLAEARELAKATKTKPKRVEGHIACNTKHGTLFLTEGKSAMGYLLKVRQASKHGGYPLRGKVMNTWGMKPVNIMKNKELNDIINILGLKLGVDSSNDMLYNDIAIMTDADVDGKGSIYPLLLAFFYQWPCLFKQGKIKFCKTPIVISKKGKDIKWFYDLDSHAKAKLKGYSDRYIKGLGSLTEKEYKKVINEPVFDTVTIDDPDCFEIMFGDDADRRKVWMS